VLAGTDVVTAAVDLSRCLLVCVSSRRPVDTYNISAALNAVAAAAAAAAETT